VAEVTAIFSVGNSLASYLKSNYPPVLNASLPATFQLAASVQIADEDTTNRDKADSILSCTGMGLLPTKFHEKLDAFDGAGASARQSERSSDGFSTLSVSSIAGIIQIDRALTPDTPPVGLAWGCYRC
jgi:hypothetical protein